MTPFKLDPLFILPPSPASDPLPVGSSRRCSFSPPVYWTSCTPGCSRCVSSRLGKTARRSRPESFPATTHLHTERICSDATTCSADVRDSSRGLDGAPYLKRVCALERFCASLQSGSGDRLLQQEGLLRSGFTWRDLRLLHEVIFVILCCTHTHTHSV